MIMLKHKFKSGTDKYKSSRAKQTYIKSTANWLAVVLFPHSQTQLIG